MAFWLRLYEIGGENGRRILIAMLLLRCGCHAKRVAVVAAGCTPLYINFSARSRKRCLCFRRHSSEARVIQERLA